MITTELTGHKRYLKDVERYGRDYFNKKNREYRQRYKNDPEFRQKRYESKKKQYQLTQGRAKTSQRYTEEELEMILAHEIPDEELAKKLGRSVMAIQVKRAKLKTERRTN